MLRRYPFLPLIALAACASEPSPVIESGVQFQKSREVLVKGVVAVASTPAYIEKRTYPVTCAPDNQGGTPEQRADKMMAAAAGVVGQVEPPGIGTNYRKSFDMQKINAYATANYRCSVGRFEPSAVTSDEKAVLQWALRHGALTEMSKER